MLKWLTYRRFNVIDTFTILAIIKFYNQGAYWYMVSTLIGMAVISAILEVYVDEKK